MNILITNDDGIWSEGLHILTDVARSFGKILAVVPEKEMSAVSHQITLHKPLRLKQIDPITYIVNGTPVDCIYLGIHLLMKNTPIDLVLSGINDNHNLGYDVFYSGTVAGAMEGFFQGIKALSISGGKNLSRKDLMAYIDTILERFIKNEVPISPWLFNINIPQNPPVRGVRFTVLGNKSYTPQITRRIDPRGKEYIWIGSDHASDLERENSDYVEVENGYISISPLMADLTNYPLLDLLKKEEQTWSI